MSTPPDRSHLAPRLVTANQPADRPYRGGAGIARFREGRAADGDRVPEDFLASTTTIHGSADVGLTVLPSGTTLREAVGEDPTGFLGAAHVERFGDDPRLLVKLINPEQRLFVHYHPADAFARARLGSTLGKTEAWVVVEAPPDGHAYVGFRRPVDLAEVAGWYTRQDVGSMLAAMHQVPLGVGDTLLVPAGQPHAISAGLTLLELQQPTDLSLILEHRGFPGLSAESALLGLDLDSALAALALTGLPADALAALVHRAPAGVEQLPGAAAEYFRLERHVVAGDVVLDPGYSVVVVVAGEGHVRHPSGDLPVARGTTLLSTFEGGPLEMSGDLVVLRCRPPAP